MPRLSLTRSTLLAVALTAVAVGLAACTSPQTTFDPRSDAADRIHDIYLLVTWAASLVGIAVLGAMAYILIKYRARAGRRAEQIHGNNALEIAWTIAPIIVILIIVIPTMVWVANSLTREPSRDAIRVTAIGHQWWFEFQYPGLGPDGGTLVTANELRIPVGREVAIELRSEDVIHSFWVPQLIGKLDMVPNRENRLEPFVPNEIGTFWGQCAEFCGVAHALMRFRVHVDSLADFNAWVAAMNAPAAEPEPNTVQASGRQTFAFQCARCHTVGGTSFRGTVGPNLTLFGERETVGAGVLPATDDNVGKWVSDVRSIKPLPDDGGVQFMPTFADDLDDRQIADVVAYLRSLRAQE